MDMKSTALPTDIFIKQELCEGADDNYGLLSTKHEKAEVKDEENITEDSSRIKQEVCEYADDTGLTLKHEELNIKDEIIHQLCPTSGYQPNLNDLKCDASEKPFRCAICDFNCSQKSNLTSHLVKHGDKPFSYDICVYECSKKSSLAKTHTGKKPYSCDICNYKFFLKLDFYRHVNTHVELKPFTCTLCGFKCMQIQNLNKHLKIHTKEKSFICNFCNSNCLDKLGLIEHLKSHTGDKPFVCTVCNYKCSLKSSLILHLNIHKRQNPLACSVCDYKCVDKSSLTRHLNRHNEVTLSYNCKLCDYKCITKTALSEHLKVHQKVKLFACTFCSCDNKFKNKPDLMRHYVLSHQTTKPDQNSAEFVETHAREKPLQSAKVKLEELCSSGESSESNDHILMDIKQEVGIQDENVSSKKGRRINILKNYRVKF